MEKLEQIKTYIKGIRIIQNNQKLRDYNEKSTNNRAWRVLAQAGERTRGNISTDHRHVSVHVRPTHTTQGGREHVRK